MESIVVGLLIIYCSLMIIPLILKRFGMGFIADPFMKFINWSIAWPFKALYRAVSKRREPMD